MRVYKIKTRLSVLRNFTFAKFLSNLSIIKIKAPPLTKRRSKKQGAIYLHKLRRDRRHTFCNRNIQFPKTTDSHPKKEKGYDEHRTYSE